MSDRYEGHNTLSVDESGWRLVKYMTRKTRKGARPRDLPMSIVFFTGFPGFLGAELLPRVLERSPEQEAVCLIQSKFIAQARSRLEDIERTYPHFRGRIELAEGDITAPDLGLEDISRIKRETSEVFHLAAVYDLSVSRDVAVQISEFSEYDLEKGQSFNNFTLCIQPFIRVPAPLRISKGVA